MLINSQIGKILILDINIVNLHLILSLTQITRNFGKKSIFYINYYEK